VIINIKDTRAKSIILSIIYIYKLHWICVTEICMLAAKKIISDRYHPLPFICVYLKLN